MTGGGDTTLDFVIRDAYLVGGQSVGDEIEEIQFRQ